jgi:hypothetical protein
VKEGALLRSKLARLLKDASDFLLGEVFLAAFAVYEFGAGHVQMKPVSVRPAIRLPTPINPGTTRRIKLLCAFGHVRKKARPIR